jgi:CBS domain-containing protein
MPGTVTDIMTEAPIHVTPQESIKNVARFMREYSEHGEMVS